MYLLIEVVLGNDQGFARLTVAGVSQFGTKLATNRHPTVVLAIMGVHIDVIFESLTNVEHASTGQTEGTQFSTARAKAQVSHKGISKRHSIDPPPLLLLALPDSVLN